MSVTSADRLLALPTLRSPTNPAEMQEFARRLGEIAAVISDKPWEGVEPLLASLWVEAKAETSWETVCAIAQRAWVSTRRLY
jgi:hypothetical protein